MKERFYFIRDEKHKPVITVCLLVDDIPSTPFIAARGVAICSDLDTPCTKPDIWKSNGPGIAKRRAWKAYKNGQGMYPIGRDEPLNVLVDIRDLVDSPWEDVQFEGIFEHKAFYKPMGLSAKELRILDAVIRESQKAVSEVATISEESEATS